MPKRDSSQPLSASPAPDFCREAALMASGRLCVAGVDEAGRGPLAGPVVVSAVVLDPARIPQGLDDSKKLTAQKREALHAQIMATAHVAVVIAPPQVIARYNIRGATLWAMRRAVLGLAVAADYALIDGRDVPQGLPCFSEAVIGGDGLSVSIAAASIIAKVTRDRMCAIMDCDEPAFGFSSHKGYSSPQHLSALATHGPGRHHRMDFAPCLEAAAARREAFTLS
ncbi:ribonuclease HII [Devosia enhydra]|nr:ribonuclease HII [Devosia enhydra]